MASATIKVRVKRADTATTFVSYTRALGEEVGDFRSDYARDKGLNPDTLAFHELLSNEEATAVDEVALDRLLPRKGRKMGFLEKWTKDTLVLAYGDPLAAGGAAAGTDGLLDEEFINAAHNATFAVLADEEPVCCGFFFTPSHALSVYHGKEWRVNEKVSGCCFRGDETMESLKFKVVATSKTLDFLVLELTAPRAHPAHLPIASVPGKRLLGAEIMRLGFGIAASKNAGSKPKELDVGHALSRTSVSILGRRHFAYSDNAAAGDSGGAVILAGGQVIGMHLGGWSHATPPEEFKEDLEALEDDRATAAGAVGSAVLSYHMLSKQINTGGWALSLLCDAVSTRLQPFLASIGGGSGSASSSASAGR